MDKDSLELLLGQGLSVERIAKRFGKDASTIDFWMEEHGLKPPFPSKHLAKGGIERGRLEGMVGEGMTIAEIADAVGLSKTTVRHWLRRYGLRTRNRPGHRMHPDARVAKEAGSLLTTLKCPRHGATEFSLEGRGYYRCKLCRSEGVTRRRRKVKEILVQEAGGRCCICGYNFCLAALQFHHVNPQEKRIEVNAKGVSLALETLRAEARKCVLLCSNCHAEVEFGATMLPARVAVEKAWLIHHNPG